jgi:hypothetical protein
LAKYAIGRRMMNIYPEKRKWGETFTVNSEKTGPEEVQDLFYAIEELTSCRGKEVGISIDQITSTEGELCAIEVIIGDWINMQIWLSSYEERWTKACEELREEGGLGNGLQDDVIIPILEGIYNMRAHYDKFATEDGILTLVIDSP